MKINLGSGHRKYDGFLNCDYDVNCNPDFVFDMEKDIWPFEDNSIEQVIAHHVFEHMGEGYFHAIKELYRVCKNGALIDIRVPHPRHDTYLADPTHRRPITPLGLSLFSKKQNQLSIKNDSPESKLGLFFDVDFEIVESQAIPDDVYIKIFSGKPKHEVERYMDEHFNIFIEYKIKLVVVKE